MDVTRSFVNSCIIFLHFHQIFITQCDLGIQLLLLFLLVLNLKTQRSVVEVLLSCTGCVVFGDQGTAMVNFGALC